MRAWILLPWIIRLFLPSQNSRRSKGESNMISFSSEIVKCLRLSHIERKYINRCSHTSTAQVFTGTHFFGTCTEFKYSRCQALRPVWRLEHTRHEFTKLRILKPFRTLNNLKTQGTDSKAVTNSSSILIQKTRDTLRAFLQKPAELNGRNIRIHWYSQSDAQMTQITIVYLSNLIWSLCTSSRSCHNFDKLQLWIHQVPSSWAKC
jgi:hypothetical protein